MHDVVPSEKLIYPVVAEPVVVRWRENEGFSGWIVDVGNTGMMLVQHQNSTDGIAEQHFLPDGNSSCPKGMEMKYSLMYVQALSSLIKWYKDYREVPDGLKKPSKLFGCTNLAMHEFRQHLLGNEIYREDNVDWQSYFYTLDMEKLVQDDQLVEKIDRMAKRAERMNYQTQYQVSEQAIS